METWGLRPVLLYPNEAAISISPKRTGKKFLYFDILVLNLGIQANQYSTIDKRKCFQSHYLVNLPAILGSTKWKSGAGQVYVKCCRVTCTSSPYSISLWYY